jgi:putative addiction module component (TIGR02574 family)
MIDNLRALPINERIKLVEDLWDSIASDQGSLSLTDAQRAELDKRLDDYESDGIIGRLACEVVSDIRKKL